MKEMIALAKSIPPWGLLPMGFLAAIGLLSKKIITFNEAIILILITLVVLLACDGRVGRTGRKESLADDDARGARSVPPRQL